MRPWHLPVSGVVDRRPAIMMFYARVASGLLALIVVIVSVSNSWTVKPALRLNTRMTGGPVAVNGTRVAAADGTESVVQMMSGARGVVLLLHGCSHAATHWFPHSPGCADCIGLPEEVRITASVLRHGFVPLAVSSTDKQHRCWRTAMTDLASKADYIRVRTALADVFSRDPALAMRPIFAVGVSSGGVFATSLPLLFNNMSGVNSIVSSGISSQWPETQTSARSVSGNAYPPVVFTHMGVLDSGTAVAVSAAMAGLSRCSIPSAQFTVRPMLVTPLYLLQAMPQWPLSLVERVTKALQDVDILGPSFKLLRNPRQSDWRSALDAPLKIELAQLGDNLVADLSPLSEELNRAWGAHEITADYFEDAFAFLLHEGAGISVSSWISTMES